VQWLQWLVGALAWRRHPAEKNVFLKFDCWHVMFLPLIQRAFPDVPWIFLYREPLEVMASAQKQLGGQMIPGVLEPGLFGWEQGMVSRMSLFEYAARALGKLCEAALAEARAGNGKLVNYRQLPASIWPVLMEYWNVVFSEKVTAHMLDVAKERQEWVLPFEADSQQRVIRPPQNCVP
jgi:hypothetical protein